MTEHVQAVVAAAERRIAELQGLVGALIVHFGAMPLEGLREPSVTATVDRDGLAEYLAKRAPKGVSEKVRKPVSGSRMPAGKRAGGKAMHGRSAEVMAKMAGVGAVFTATEVTRALGVKRADSQLSRWKDLGWVRRLGEGKWERTGKWPGEGKAPSTNIQAPEKLQTPSSKKLPSADLGAVSQENSYKGSELEPWAELSRPQMEADLAGALKLRDKARENGQEKLAAIHQQKVTRLSAILGK